MPKIIRKCFIYNVRIIGLDCIRFVNLADLASLISFVNFASFISLVSFAHFFSRKNRMTRFNYLTVSTFFDLCHCFSMLVVNFVTGENRLTKFNYLTVPRTFELCQNIEMELCQNIEKSDKVQNPKNSNTLQILYGQLCQHV